MMIPRTFRLRKTDEFDRVFSEGRAAHGRLISLRLRPADGFKAGFVVGKSVSERAVVRNRTKRRLRDIVRTAQPRLGTAEIVVSAKRPAATAEHAALADEFNALLARLERPEDRA